MPGLLPLARRQPGNFIARGAADPRDLVGLSPQARQEAIDFLCAFAPASPLLRQLVDVPLALRASPNFDAFELAVTLDVLPERLRAGAVTVPFEAGGRVWALRLEAAHPEGPLTVSLGLRAGAAPSRGWSVSLMVESDGAGVGAGAALQGRHPGDVALKMSGGVQSAQLLQARPLQIAINFHAL
jgi:hypothetical protein